MATSQKPTNIPLELAMKLFGQVALLVAMIKEPGFYLVPEDWTALANAFGAGTYELVLDQNSRLHKAKSWGDPDYSKQVSDLLERRFSDDETDAIGLALALSEEAIEMLEENKQGLARRKCPLVFDLVENTERWYEVSRGDAEVLKQLENIRPTLSEKSPLEQGKMILEKLSTILDSQQVIIEKLDVNHEISFRTLHLLLRIDYSNEEERFRIIQELEKIASELGDKTLWQKIKEKLSVLADSQGVIEIVRFLLPYLLLPGLPT